MLFLLMDYSVNELTYFLVRPRPETYIICIFYPAGGLEKNEHMLNTLPRSNFASCINLTFRVVPKYTYFFLRPPYLRTITSPKN